MPLTQIGLSASVTWQLARGVSGFADVTQGSDTASFSSNGLNVGTWNEVFATQYAIAAAGTQAVDLRTFTDLTGTAVTADKALALIVLVTGAVSDKLNVKPHGTNGLQWFFGGTAEGTNVPGGGFLMFSEGPTSAGTAVDATHKQLLLTNNGSAPLTVKVVALLSDV
ncbi:hypothetical protein J8F10_13635 [Gemmata sp. G18]|uniref:Uncharacterized protein n=1 Tax=Gemmata palustris TaxID=2822762 RepID=A0ABS5BRG2_9BACT|nr:hypothetical protein [Gemmata palustris]MBP3956327.1 hypothetical protein [Gemmata palustris]